MPDPVKSGAVETRKFDVDIGGIIRPDFTTNKVITAQYTTLNFLPKNLFKQFKQAANTYFLVICCLQCVPMISITNGLPTTFPPLFFVVFVAMLKDFYEDYFRHKADEVENQRFAEVVKSSTTEKTHWQDIKVGQIVLLRNRDLIPADLIMLATADKDSLCFNMTANLDGETNLKTRQVASGMDKVVPKSGNGPPLSAANGVKASVECELPNKNIHRFEGTFNISAGGSYKSGESFAIGPKNILLRGTQVRNCDWVLGVVMYTGPQTKIMKNMIEPPTKQSKLNKETNTLTIQMFLSLLVFCAIGAVVGTAWNASESVQNMDFLWATRAIHGEHTMHPDKGDISSDQYSGAEFFFLKFFTYILVFTNYIPISLLVTQEMVKFFQRFFFQWDIDMYHAENDIPMKVRCSDLNDELGMVEHIFSDKTGTLTCNVMEFRKCIIGGKGYGLGTTGYALGGASSSSSSSSTSSNADGKKDPNDRGDGKPEPTTSNVNFVDPALWQLMQQGGEDAELAKQFFLHLAINHEVMPETADDPKGGKTLIYSGPSPDEGALVNAARHFGYKFTARTIDTVTVSHIDASDDAKEQGQGVGRSVKYELLHTLEFNSTRKRSSVIVKDAATGKLFMYTKGADNIIRTRLEASKFGPTSRIIADTDEMLDHYAAEGLRTLMIAYRELPASEYEAWKASYHSAETSLQDRSGKMEKLQDEIEVDLVLLGATAIEDKLQDGVVDAISSLRQAGIKVWVLTGDKVDTAITISRGAALVTPEMTLLRICAEDKEMAMDALLIPTEAAIKNKLNEMTAAARKLQSEKREVAVVLDTAALEAVWNYNLNLPFAALCAMCKSVVCARVTPDQKGQIVSQVQNATKNSVDAPTCLAIGDGANDVNMIQNAHIGVGIAGLEGLQACNASDFAIGQFRFLKKLLLVHGRWSTRRMSVLTWYMFYKNVLLVMPQWWFGMYCLFSGQNFYFDGLYQFYNMAQTGLPVFATGIFDKDVSAELSLAFPQLFADGREKAFFSKRKFWWYIGEAMVSAMVIFFFAAGTFAYNDNIGGNKGLFVWDIGTTVFFAVSVVANFRLMFETKTWTALFVAFLVFCFVTYFVQLKVFDFTGLGMWDSMNGLLGSFWPIVSMPSFWLYIVLTVVATWVLYFAQLGWEVVQNPAAKRLVVAESSKGYGASSGPVPMRVLENEMS